MDAKGHDDLNEIIHGAADTQGNRAGQSPGDQPAHLKWPRSPKTG